MLTTNGLDASFELTKHAISLKAQGIDFVMRYYSYNASKNLSLAEARALSDAGLKIGVVWETAGTYSGFFNRLQGLADGSAAYQMASNSIGQPLGSTIYFAVDYDPSATDIATSISDYFFGIGDAFDAASKGAAGYRIGVYGSGLCCKTLLTNNLAEMSWLSQSTGFAGSKDYASSQSYNLIQYLPTKITVDDDNALSVDPDATNSARPAGLFTIL
jgi:hypothetical protein